MDADPVERKLAAILSADVVGYSRLMAEDEDATVRLVTAYREEVELLVHQHRGRLVDFTGDNFLAEFASAVAAVGCALEIQDVLQARNARLPSDRRMVFRMGLHLGEVRTEGDRLFGTGVNVAARIQTLAEPGGVCISSAVKDQVGSKLELAYEDMGEQTVKNVPDPVHAYRVSAQSAEIAASAPSFGSRAALAAAGVLVAALAFGAWRIYAPGPDAPAGPAPGPIVSIAVLPLDNLSGDPDQEYFADGMTEALISDLARLGSLRVISRTSVMQFKGARQPLPEIARALNVDAIVEGSVLRAGNAVRITAQLIDARTDYHIWARDYERDFEDVLALQREVARAIALGIALELTPEEEAELARAEPVDPAAHEAYLKGRFFQRKQTPVATVKAMEHFEEAISSSPDYPLGYAGKADTLSCSPLHLWSSVEAWQGRPEAALAAFEQALELNPRYPPAHQGLGRSLCASGRADAGLASLERARELSPDDPLIVADIATCYAQSGRRDAARELLVELEARAQAGYTSPVSLALVHLALDQPDEALEQLERAYEARAFYVTHIGVEPRYDPVRSDARFQDLLRRMGLGDSAAPHVARAATS